MIPLAAFSQSAAISGSIFSDNRESDIRAGGVTIDIQLTNAFWSFNLGSDSEATKGLIEGFAGDENWDVVKAALDYTHITRRSGTAAQIILPAVPAYFLAGDETITLTIPTVSLLLATSSIDAKPEILIENEPASIAVSGSIQDGTTDTEVDIRTASSTIILTVSGDVWNANVGSNNPVTAALVNGIAGSTSWNDNVVTTILGSNNGATNVSRSGNVVTIDIPASQDYNIIANDNITINVPNQVLNYTLSGTVTGNPGLVVYPAEGSASINDPGLTESNLDGATLTLTLTEAEFKNPTLAVSNFTHNGPGVISIDAVTYVNRTTATITLGLNGNLENDVDNFQITVNATELDINTSLTTNGIGIVSEFTPVITNVTIEQDTYGIGDQVTVLISVEDDGGNEFTYYDGTVANKQLESLERVSSTSYSGLFTVQQGDQSYTASQLIPVSNLQLAFQTAQSSPYSGNISNGTVIDAARPVINYMQAPSGVKKVGDLVDIIVSADGAGYTAVDLQTRVNNVPLSNANVSFIELGSGVYILRYMVAEGDDDVSPGSLTASLQLEDAAGNLSLVKTSFTSNTTTIDANSPKVTSISVDDGVYNIGDVIEVDIVADGSNYSATNETTINGVPLSSSAVTFSNVSGNQYRLLYTIRSVDPEVLPGNLVVVVSLRDAAGNIGQPYSDVEPNSLAIYTALPSAVLSGTQTICEGNEAILNVSLTGRSPWKIYLNDGSGNTEYANVSASPFEIAVDPLVTTNYTIDSVVDVNGTMNNGTGTARITVRQSTAVEITNLNSTYFVEAEPFVLQGSPPGGVFSGPGVNSAQGIFDPAAADTIDSPHTLYYTYTNIYGCVSVDSALVFVLGARGDLFIPKDIYCNSDDPFTVSGSNVAEVIGTFKLYSSDGQDIPVINDNGDNTATIDPAVLTEGDYYVTYQYFDQILFELTEEFSVEAPEAPEILIPDRDEYCQNEEPFLLGSSVASAVFEGPGVSGTVEDGFIFDPRAASAGELNLTLTNTSANGCVSSSSKTISLLAVPEINFTVDRLCVSSRDTVFFTNTTANKSLFKSWYWEFGDPESGVADTSTQVAPWHLYKEAGSRDITLIGETNSGCVDTLERTIDFGDNPTGSFSWDNECFSEGIEITFTSEMQSINEFDSYEWTIIDPDIGNITKNGPVIEHTFDNMYSYTIRLYAETVIGCSKTVERKLNLKPTFEITPEDNYTENFTGGNGWWSAEQADTSDHLSWKYDEVSFSNMNGQKSYGWYTDLPQSPLHEYSWVKSPCYDLSATDRPMIAMDIYQSLERNVEGVILQATRDGGNTWESVGKVNSGLNWYNSGEILLRPGGDSVGWTGNDPFQADEGWVNARHDLGSFAGEKTVQFRVAFSTDNSSEEEMREGFAFDDVMIANKTRKVLIEHFTNTSSSDTREPSGEINSIYNTNYEDAVKLEYHTSFPGSDPFNAHNSAVPATRAFYYGVTSVPYVLLDGAYTEDLSFDYSPARLAGSDVSRQSLIDATFDIEIDAVYLQNRVEVEVIVSALENLNPAERIIQVVVYEKLISDVPTANGATNFLNVVKTMLPNSAGTAVFDGWFRDQTRVYQFSWDFDNVYDPEMIRVAAFIQNDDTREVYQVTADDTTNLTTSSRDLQLQAPDINLYPNPASDQLFIHINAGETQPQNYKIEMLDQMGRTVMTETLFQSYSAQAIDIHSLARGVYFVRVIDERGLVLRTEKVVVVR
jgi:hypothetical protein